MLMIECLMVVFTVHCSYMSIVDCGTPVELLTSLFFSFECNVWLLFLLFVSVSFSLSLLSAAVKQLCVVISNQISEYFGNNFNISEDKAAESLSIISKVKRKGIGINSYLCYSSCAKAAIHLHDPVLFARKKVSFFHLLFLSFSHSLFVCFFIAFAIFGSKDIT